MREVIMRQKKRQMQRLTMTAALLLTLTFGPKAQAQENVTVLNPGQINELVKGQKYKFNDKTFTDLWRDAKSSADKIFTFGWFDESGTFLGVSGSYDIQNPTREGRGYNGNYYDIIPIANSGATDAQDRYEHLRYSTGTALDLTKGALYLGGSKNGFGIPEVNGIWGWNEDNDHRVQANSEIMGSAVPQIEAGKYRFDITTGDQVNAWSNEGEPLLFKLFHYKKWFYSVGEADVCGNFEFKHTNNDISATFNYNNTAYNQTFYYVEKNTDKSPLGGMFEVTNSTDPSLGNGNIHGVAIGQDSDLPKFPNGYTFRFDLNLNENAWNFPLCVSLQGRPDDASVDGTNTWHAADFNNKTGNVGNITVNLNNKNGEKRISLRDALRLDWNIPYANSNPKDEKSDNVVSIDIITIKGNMSVDDLYFLGDMVAINKITNIDLKDAVIENNQIPAAFAAAAADQTLKSIILPSYTYTENGEKKAVNIGAYAFENCTALETVTFSNDAYVMIGAGAFRNCRKLTNESIQEIINHSYATLRESVFEGTAASDIEIPARTVLIAKNAFKDTGLKRLTLPAECTGNKSTLTPYNNWILPGAIGGVFVKDNNVELGVDEARQARTLDVDRENITIEGEDFNKEYGSGWFNNGDGTSTGAFDTGYRSDFTVDSYNFAIVNESGQHKLGYMKKYYWFNYSFRVAEGAAGNYKLSACVSSGSDGDKHPEFAIDGGSENIVMTLTKTDWAPWNHQETVGYVALEPGIHYITYYSDTDVDLDRFILEKVDALGTPQFKAGPYTGKVVTEYRLEESDEKASILSSDKDAFNGVIANHCEVVFPEGTSADMIKGYRNEGTGDYSIDNCGIMTLLTKTVSEDTPYDVVYQEHADVKATRTFASKKWNSVVFPFTVTGKILKNATDNAGTLEEPFSRAAYLFDNNYGVPGYDVKMRFVYLDNQNTFNESGTEEIKAGTPFLLFVDDTKTAPTDNVYVFKDITTPAVSTTIGVGYNVDKVLKVVNPADDKGITDYSFNGRLDYKTGNAAFANKIYWVAASKYYWGRNVTMKNMRSWFEPKTEAGAHAIESLFGFFGGNPTGIDIIATDSQPTNDNIYNLQGQCVRSGSASTKGLPKGVYIMNGKRITVK